MGMIKKIKDRVIDIYDWVIELYHDDPGFSGPFLVGGAWTIMMLILLWLNIENVHIQPKFFFYFFILTSYSFPALFIFSIEKRKGLLDKNLNLWKTFKWFIQFLYLSLLGAMVYIMVLIVLSIPTLLLIKLGKSIF